MVARCDQRLPEDARRSSASDTAPRSKGKHITHASWVSRTRSTIRRPRVCRSRCPQPTVGRSVERPDKQKVRTGSRPRFESLPSARAVQRQRRAVQRTSTYAGKPVRLPELRRHSTRAEESVGYGFTDMIRANTSKSEGAGRLRRQRRHHRIRQKRVQGSAERQPRGWS